ncbi:porphobilinogen deaminase [Pluteus cervinus]|uniref:Porphobilinogen deaminase n=1 Tax=Pluteus cervinus TaxID=181527 RepID=A0ACD3BG72_9AGAR|nr:porphobilinogen deaminase [Pluteus cervinus]
MATGGDKNQSQALYLLGGKELWTKELEVALNEKAVDMLVHSLKDVQTSLPKGCVLAAILEREDPVDCLVVKAGLTWKSLDEFPDGTVVGTSSVRRVAQLKRRYPALKFLDVRGNLGTRLAKLDAPDGPYAALILAKAGIVRLGLGNRVTSDIGPPVLHHAVSQGALGVEVRSDDHEAVELCKKINHWPTQWKCTAERACLRVLEGGCSVPVGVSSQLETVDGQVGGQLSLTACVTALNGEAHVEHSLTETVTSVEQAEKVGEQLARVLLESGARQILDDITKDRDHKVKEAQAAEA